ncbi:hypothetical protein [Maridesulfovibrio frigidus]|uniref:hypothetical protein n=1 Tax=Maridesulfovibrio frigidus TaxID=340956 RepID=UPI0004E1F578|nr:hypothetical protein [Maridesulfovibrio frigidus]
MRTELIELFRGKGIDFSSVGFYDEKNFLKAEQKDPDFLRNYGFWIRNKKYDDDYLKYVRETIPHVLQPMHDELVKDGSQGACVNMSLALSKILEKLGIWNVMVEGSFNAVYPSSSQITEKFLWQYDSPQHVESRISPGHVWLHCPPFNIIDLTIKYQPYTQKQAEYLPEIVAQEEVNEFKATINDICSPSTTEWLQSKLATERSFFSTIGFDYFSSKETPKSFNYGDTKLRYIPCSFTAADGPLETMKCLQLSGKYPLEIYEKNIHPNIPSK